MKIGYIGGFWATNIGNSFYNLGALHLLKKIFGEDNVFFVPDPPQWFWSNVKNDYPLIEKLDLDMFVISGPCLSTSLIKVYKTLFDSLKQNNKKLAFISTGASAYTEEEAEEVSKFLNNYDVEFLMTRDTSTYDLYRNRVNTVVFDGICTSMFLNDAVNVPNVNDDYIVSNFAFFKEPEITYDGQWSAKHRLLPVFQKEINGYKVVRTNNATIMPRIPKVHEGYLLFQRDNSYYSDLPYGYLSILKSAKTVFSDRVHTCAATLIFGGEAMYIKGSKRSTDGRNNLFSRIGVDTIYSQPTKLDLNMIIQEKQKMISFLEAQKDHILN